MSRAFWGFAVGTVFVLSLSGCTEVHTYVGPRGAITQEVKISVPQRFAEGVKVITEKLLGTGWRVRVDGRGEVWSVRAWRRFSADPEGRPLPGVSFKFKRVNHWFRATYQLQAHYDPKELFVTEAEQALLANVTATVYIHMPGTVRADLSNVQADASGVVSLELNPLRPATVQLTSVGVLWWRVGLLLVVIGIILFLVAPYIPRILALVRPVRIRVVEE
ncbi:MAG: hypothetical protein NZ959_01145 [Armatimonadetes bacterium]|nr:hypothetical protein [Armatimonadota bacterium]MDW8121881.1 hypothetical protein [Armatimonadota bacterium]